MAMHSLNFVGPFPGPVTGQTVMTRHIHDRLRREAPAGVEVTAYDIVRGDTGNGLGNAAIKAGRALRTIAGLILRGRGRNCYISVDANRGMINTVAYAAAARLGGAGQIVLHHHSRTHVDSSTAPMRALARVAGKGAIHLCICPSMARALATRYPALGRTAAMSNIVSMNDAPTTGDGPGATRPPHPATWRLGHMSKLGMAKGLGRAIETLEALQAAGIPAELTLAGSFASEADRAHAEAAAQRLGPALQIAGPLYGAQKAEWFRSLDLFLFPSLYRNETQGIVNLEALAAGTPVIAFGGHCIEDDLAGLTGWCLPPEADYPARVVAFQQEVAGSEAGLDPLRAQAIDRFHGLVTQADGAFSRLTGYCFGDPE